MKKKAIGIIFVILLFATSFSAMGTIDNETVDLKTSMEKTPYSNDIFWSENFDSYHLGQCLDGGSDDGGWEIEYNIEGAYVVDDQVRSTPHSVEILGLATIWHRFSGVYSGNWTFTGWVYVPADFDKESAILFHSYYKFKPRNYYCQFGIEFDGEEDLACIIFPHEYENFA